MIKIIGMETKRVYAEGSPEECFRKLDKKYPYIKGAKGGELGHVYPEALLVVKK